MADEVFTEPDDTHANWVDVRMTDPDEGEWDTDIIVAEGRVEYVDLRIRPEMLTAFVECLLDDVSEEQASTVIRTLVDRSELDVLGDPSE